MHPLTMNKLRHHLLAFVALTISAIVLHAHPANGHDHKGLRFDAVGATLTFVDGTAATWTVDNNKDDTYTIVITQPTSVGAGTLDKDCALSLLTLGIQNLVAGSKVKVVSGTIRIKKTTQAGEQWTADLGPGSRFKLDSIGMQSGAIAAENVGLLRIMGTTCTLEVVSERIRPGHSSAQAKFGMLSNHDTTPPPAYGGGEN